jgi:hypothetical protein
MIEIDVYMRIIFKTLEEIHMNINMRHKVVLFGRLLKILNRYNKLDANK